MSADAQVPTVVDLLYPAIELGPVAEDDPFPVEGQSRIVRELIEQLERADVRYVHWKSNARLEDTLCGQEDIDLLVRPQDSEKFIGVITRCGFKLGTSRWGAGHPGVFHALVWDAELCRIVDLHAYYQLVSGDSFTKSYRFAIERELLERRTTLLGCRVPDPSQELVLFLVRCLLKHSSLIEIQKVSKGFEQALDELCWLLGRADLPAAEDWRSEVMPAIPYSVSELVAGMKRGRLGRIVMGCRLAWALRGSRRLRPAFVPLLRLIRVARHYAARIRGRRTLSLQSGGSWIALVGPKGTGKSTLATLLGKRLGAKLDVKVVHLGKPPVGLLSAFVNLWKPLAQRALPSERLCEYERPERRSERRYSFLFILRKLLLARDRRRLLDRCQREITSGTIIISDRCPTTNASGLDGSAFDDLAVTTENSRIKRWMMCREQAIYRALPRPTLVIKLEAPLELAIARDRFRGKPGGPDALAIARRWKIESEAEFARSAIRTISTNGSIEESLRKVGTAVWESI